MQGEATEMEISPGPESSSNSNNKNAQSGKEVEEENEDDLPMKDITKPLEFDVLCGRGGAALRHPGNQTYRRLVHLNKYLYTTCLKAEKLKISRSIVAAIREQNGRFLEKDTKKGTWYDIGDKKALEKTSQALREGQPKLRKTIEGLKANTNQQQPAAAPPAPAPATVPAAAAAVPAAVPSSAAEGRPDLSEYRLPSLRTRAMRPSLERPTLEKKEFVQDLSAFVVPTEHLEQNNNNNNNNNSGGLSGEIHTDEFVLMDDAHHDLDEDDSPVSLWDASDHQLATSSSLSHPSLIIAENDVLSYMNDEKPTTTTSSSSTGSSPQNMDLRQVFAKLKARRPPSAILTSNPGDNYTNNNNNNNGSATKIGSGLLFATSVTSSLGQTLASNPSLLTSTRSSFTGDVWRSKEFGESATSAAANTTKTGGGGSKRSLLSNFSKVSGVSGMSLVSNLSDKIGDIGSVRSIAMSDFSALEEEDLLDEQQHLYKLDTIVGSTAEMEMSHNIKM